MKKILAVAITPVFLLTACSGMSNTQQRELSGAGIGAVAGAGIVAIAGGTAIWGAVGGAVVGAAGGYVYDQYEKSKQEEYNSGYKAGKATQPNN